MVSVHGDMENWFSQSMLTQCLNSDSAAHTACIYL